MEARDERLLCGLRAGEARALEEAFFAYYDGLYRFAFRYTRERETAEELIQDVFLRIWTRRDQMIGTERLRPFLYGAVRNAAVSRLRHERVARSLAARLLGRPARQAAERSMHDSPNAGGFADPTPCRGAVEAAHVPGMSQYAADAAAAESAHAARDRADELRQAVEQLPPRARLAITLRWQRQLRNAEIAEVMGISIKAVEFSIARALNHLRRTLDPP